MNNIRNYIPTVKYLTKSEASLFLDKPLRIMDNKNIIMMCKLFRCDISKTIIDSILYSIVKHSNYNWLHNFKIINDELNNELNNWISLLNIK